MKLQTQPIWITLELFIEDGQTKIVREQSPKINLSKEQKLKVAEKIRLIRERSRAMRVHGTGFRISESFSI